MFFIENFLFFIAIFFFFFGYSKCPELFNFDFSVVKKFSVFVFTVFVIRQILMTILVRHFDFPYEHQAHFALISDVLHVYWEDLVFVLPYLILWHKFGKKAIWALPVFLLTTFIFAAGHLYQGPAGWITAIYPPLALYFSKKFGITTVMACHVVYDILVVSIVSLTPYLLRLF